MEKSPLAAWLELCMMPAKFQAALIGGMMTGALQASTALTLGTTGRRRSTANLTLVASNNWAPKRKSTAILSVVPN
jgi:hypothetical protein